MIKKSASLVVGVIDDFTGKLIKSGVNVNLNGINAFDKKDGFHVFINVDIEDGVMIINSNEHIKKVVEYVKDIKEDIKYIRLVPNIKYNSQNEIYKVEFFEQENLEHIAIKNSCEAYVLAEDVEKGSNEINIFSNTNKMLDGKQFLINSEIINITSHNNRCILQNELKDSYKKGTKLYSCKEFFKQNQDIYEFYVYYPEYRKENINLILLSEGGKQKEYEIELQKI